MDLAPIDAYHRVGLRYIDESASLGEGLVDWSEWINPSLLGPSRRLD